ncbi:hypothetical protein BT69DRAFT_1286213, partial [Atractiella rhizophila]
FSRITDSEIAGLNLPPIPPSPSPPPVNSRRRLPPPPEPVEQYKVFLPNLPPPKKRLKESSDLMPQYMQPYQIFLEEWFAPYEGKELAEIVDEIVDLVPVEGDPCSSYREGKKLEKEMEIWAKVKHLEEFGDGVEMDPSLKKNVEHKRKEDHRDALVLHATSLAKLWGLGYEGKARVHGREKKGPLGKIVKEYWANKETREKEAEEAEEKERKANARWIAKEIKKKWREAYDLVMARKEEAERIEREKEGKKQLDRLLEQSRELLGGRGRGTSEDEEEEEEEEEEEYEDGAVSDDTEEEVNSEDHHDNNNPTTPSSEAFEPNGVDEPEGALEDDEIDMEAMMREEAGELPVQISDAFSITRQRPPPIVPDLSSLATAALTPSMNLHASQNVSSLLPPADVAALSAIESEDYAELEKEPDHHQIHADVENDRERNSEFEDEEDDDRAQDDEQMEAEMEGEEDGANEDSEEEMRELEEDANLTVEELRRKYYGDG